MDGNLVRAPFFLSVPDQEPLAVSRKCWNGWPSLRDRAPGVWCWFAAYFNRLPRLRLNPKDVGRFNEDCWFRRDPSRSGCRSGNLEGFTSCDGSYLLWAWCISVESEKHNLLLPFHTIIECCLNFKFHMKFQQASAKDAEISCQTAGSQVTSENYKDIFAFWLFTSEFGRLGFRGISYVFVLLFCV